MDDTNQSSAAGYSFDQAVEFAESTSDDYYASIGTLDDETDDWPRYEPEAVNFGDF